MDKLAVDDPGVNFVLLRVGISDGVVRAPVDMTMEAAVRTQDQFSIYDPDYVLLRFKQANGTRVVPSRRVRSSQ